jgi:diguanylate cyclase (GGDEF)-like protein
MPSNIYRVWGSASSIPSYRAFEFIVNRGRQAVFVGLVSIALIYIVGHGTIPIAQFLQLAVLIGALIYMRYRWVAPFEGKTLEQEQCKRLERGYFAYSLLIGIGFGLWGLLLHRHSAETASSLVLTAAMASLMTLHFLAGSFPSFLAITGPLICAALFSQLSHSPASQGPLALLLVFFYALSIRMLFMHRRALFSILSERERRDSLDRQYHVLMANDTVAIAVTEGLELLVANQRFRDLIGRNVNLTEDPTPSEVLLRGGLNPKYLRKVMPRILERVRRKGALKFNLELHTDRRDSLSLALEARLADPGSTIPKLLWLVTDVSASKKASDELNFFAQHDALTGLANRYQFTIAARRALQHLLVEPSLIDGRVALNEQAPATHAQLAVLTMDLDGFKMINDSFGHPTGDRVLVVIAKRLANALRHEDVVARFGGDEFVVLLKNMQSRAEAKAVLDKITDVICAPIELDEFKLSVGVSIGLAMSPDEGVNIEALLGVADKHMYESKQAGKRRKAVAEADELERQPLLI